MAEGFRVYLRLARANIRGQLQYRASFALDVVATFALSFLDFFGVLILFHNVPRLAEWNVHQVAFLYAVSAVCFALGELLVGHTEVLAERLRRGTFDQLLVRPRGTLFQLLADDLPLRRLGRAAQGFVVLAYALAALNVQWDVWRVLFVPVAVVAGIVIFASVWIVGACLAFWTTDGGEFTNAFTYGGNFLTQYPIDIYSAWARRFLAYLVPMAFVCYFPALYVLGKADPLGLPHVLQFLSPVVAAVAAAVAGVVWRGAVRHYRSAGG